MTKIATASGTVSFRIQTMDCAAEESEIRCALEPVTGIDSLSFHLGTRTIVITAAEAVIAEAVTAIRKAGFDPQPLTPSTEGIKPGAEEHGPAGMGGGLWKLLAALMLACAAEGISFFAGEGTTIKGIEMVLAKGGTYLEEARKLKAIAIAIDKTGTITEGKPILVEFVRLDPRERRNSSNCSPRVSRVVRTIRSRRPCEVIPEHHNVYYVKS